MEKKIAHLICQIFAVVNFIRIAFFNVLFVYFIYTVIKRIIRKK